MKNDKFDYFEPSPHPRQLKLINLEQGSLHNLQDIAHHEDQLFNTPARSNIHFNTNKTLNIDPYFTHQHKKPKKQHEDDYFGQHSQQVQNAEEEYDYVPKIEERIEYSDEIIIPSTPAKNIVQKHQNLQLQAATRKKTFIQYTPVSDTISHQRGLKKLAYEAYNFVCRQKKTTYKEVASKLINQLNDEQIHGSADANSKKGEMNIKRRVYDALNVLIALGLLKRNGNRIVGTKTEIDKTTFQKLDSQKQKKKQQFLLEELRLLQQDYLRKMENMKEKQRIFTVLKRKINHLKRLQTRNRSGQENNIKRSIKVQNEQVIEFPFIMLGLSENESSMRDEMSPNQQLVLWQQSRNVLVVSYNKRYLLNLKGDLDLISNINIYERFAENYDRSERRSNKSK